MEYDFADATPAERAEAADLVAGAAITYRWDPGFVLRVGAADEDRVDALFGHDSEERQALASLRVVADLLVGDWVASASEEVLADLADATGVVSTADPPEMVNRVFWATVAHLARQLLQLTEDPDVPDEDVAAAASALKAVLG